MAKEHGLGKGLGAIFGTSATVNTERPKVEHRYKTVAEAAAEKKQAETSRTSEGTTKRKSSERKKHPASAEALNGGEGQTSGSVDTERSTAAVSSVRSMETVQDTEDGMMLVKLSRIQPDHDQPRKNFDEEKLQELADSIRTYGVISPIVVKKRGAFYEIVAGERRWRAARIAGLKEIPVVVKEVDEKTSRELAIIENIQRDDLNAVEEARAYQSLIEEYGLTQEEVAARVAKNRSTITNSLRLLKLDPEILQLLQEEKITQGHARALLSVEDPELRKKIAEKCTKENLSVREIETLVKLDRLSKEKKERKSSPEAQELRRLKVIYRDLEKKMKTKLGTKVSIVPKNTERGTLEIEYYSQDDLDRIFMILNSSHQN